MSGTDTRRKPGADLNHAGDAAFATRPLKVRTVVDAIAGDMRSRILMGELNPDDTVTEKETAERYGVARPTAKAAVERLVEVGLLRRSGNKTAYVPRLTRREIADIYRCRALVEGEAVMGLARARKVPDEVVHLLKTSDAPGQSALERLTAEIELRQALVDGFGSPRLSRMNDILMAEAHLCLAEEMGSAGPLAERYAPLIAAIRRGDELVARQIVENWMATSADRLGVSG